MAAAIWGGFFTPVWAREVVNPTLWCEFIRWEWSEYIDGAGWGVVKTLTSQGFNKMCSSLLHFVHKNNFLWSSLWRFIGSLHWLRRMQPTVPMLNPKRRNGGGINWLVFGNFTLSDKIPRINWDLACKLARAGWQLANVWQPVAQYGNVWQCMTNTWQCMTNTWQCMTNVWHSMAMYDNLWQTWRCVAICGKMWQSKYGNV